MPQNRKQIRTGPHPLSLHVATATQSWTGAAASFPLFTLGGVQIHPDLASQANALKKRLRGADLPDLQLTVIKKAQERLSATLAGIAAYQHHSHQRKSPPVPLFHHIGSTEVRNYGTGIGENAPVVLAVPSLVNPAYILDLEEDHSFMRSAAAAGIHPYLLDWTRPEVAEMGFGLDGYITERLIPIIRQLHQHHRRKIHLLGYCMGGNLSVAAAQILQDEDILASLTLIATPWDFHAGQSPHQPAITDYFLGMTARAQQTEAITRNIMQLFFFSLDPGLSDRKFRKFANMDQGSEAAQNFVAIEDWANDGAPLSPALARDCLINWYRDNLPGRGSWRVGGHIIDPGRLTLPGQIIIPRSDRIVPAASANALRQKLPHFHHHLTRGGHVSIIAGKNAPQSLWPQIISEIRKNQ